MIERPIERPVERVLEETLFSLEQEPQFGNEQVNQFLRLRLPGRYSSRSPTRGIRMGVALTIFFGSCVCFLIYFGLSHQVSNRPSAAMNPSLNDLVRFLNESPSAFRYVFFSLVIAVPELLYIAYRSWVVRAIWYRLVFGNWLRGPERSN